MTAPGIAAALPPNEAFGWLSISLGFLTGALLGTGFLKPGFLGGYDSPRRRLLRLGHIALVALGVLNILFALGRERIGWNAGLVDTAAWAMIAGGALMPTCCALAAWRQRLSPLFVVPVLLLSFAGTVAWTGMVLR